MMLKGFKLYFNIDNSLINNGMLLHIPVLLWSGLIWRLHSVNDVLDLMRCPRVEAFAFICGVAPEALFP